MDIVCLSSAYWDEPMPTNKQQIMGRIAARGHRVLYVDPGLSRPGLQRVRAQPRRAFRWFSQPLPTLWRFEPLLPLRQAPAPLRPIMWRLMGGIVRRWLAGQGWERPVLWLYPPEAFPTVAPIPHRRLVYHCVDHWRSFPQFAHRQAEIGHLEDALTRQADLVITTAPALQQERARLNPHTVFLPNVGDYEHFARAAGPLPEPAALRGLPHPRLLFWGALDDYKFDLALTHAIAVALPEAQILLIGPSGVAHTSAAITQSELPNIHRLGHRPYAELPAYAAACDLCFIPYQQTAHTAGVFPIKFFEMLATGHPVVATALPSLRPYGDVAALADSPEAFVAAIRAALTNPEAGRDARMALAARHTWEQRVTDILALLEG